MPWADLNGLTLYYEEHGQPEAPPLLLLHPFLATNAYWSPHLAAFGARYRLIVPDLRGHGRTDCPGGLASMNHHQFARDIIALCEHLGISHTIFCGESSGAMLLLWLALDAPHLVRALVVTGATYFYGDELRAWWRRQTPESVVRGQDTDDLARHRALGSQHWRFTAEAFIALGTHTHTDDFPEESLLGAIDAPVLIVHGDRDFFFPVSVPAGLYALLPDAELCILPATGHMPPTERPEWFNAAVFDFLSRRIDSPAGDEEAP